MRKAWEENNFTDLFELLGTQETQSVLDVGEEPDPEYTSSEYTVADGALVADGTGYMLKHPFVNHRLQKVLARWAYRPCTSGGFRLPGFRLADLRCRGPRRGPGVCTSGGGPTARRI